MSKRDWFPEDDDEKDYYKCEDCGKNFSCPVDFDFSGELGVAVICRQCNKNYD